METKSIQSVTCGDIRLHTREVLDRVFQGETIIITRYGKPVAVLVPWATWERLETETAQMNGLSRQQKNTMGNMITPM